MKLAIMQPYFLPYLGYWQLIQAADIFILFNDVQYIRHGWINRNRVLKHGGGWQYIRINLKKHSRKELIKNIYVQDEIEWRSQILRQLEHYKYIRAPFYSETIDLLSNIFSNITSNKITKINEKLIIGICHYLNIKTDIIVSSEKKFIYENIRHAGQWALRIAEQMNSTEYINPISGMDLFDPKEFQKSDIKLSFLLSHEIKYSQGVEFMPSLSIVDVLMFNGQNITQSLLREYSLRSGL